ncbi:MAG TPA: hypothetical protein PLZ57_01600 [Pseudobdellovibrionaceae bacterium]|nr:hypothetical protein [Pseudobdellovibrionaceae bacterium]
MASGQIRNVLIVGFYDGQLKPDEIVPILTEVERDLGLKGAKENVKFRIRQKIVPETMWPNDLAQSEGKREACDDVILVAVTIKPTFYDDSEQSIGSQLLNMVSFSGSAVETKGWIRIAYINTASGVSSILTNGEASESSRHGGAVGLGRTKPAVLQALKEKLRELRFPVFSREPAFVAAPEAKPESADGNVERVQIAISEIKSQNVPQLILSALPGVIKGSMEDTRHFVTLSRGESLNVALGEISASRSIAFDAGKLKKFGGFAGAKLLVLPEVFCEEVRCILNFSLIDLESGETLRTSSKEADQQLISFKRAVESIAIEFRDQSILRGIGK